MTVMQVSFSSVYFWCGLSEQNKVKLLNTSVSELFGWLPQLAAAVRHVSHEYVAFRFPQERETERNRTKRQLTLVEVSVSRASGPWHICSHVAIAELFNSGRGGWTGVVTFDGCQKGNLCKLLHSFVKPYTTLACPEYVKRMLSVQPCLKQP